MKIQFIFAMAALAATVLVGEIASAATATSSMNVRIQITAECVITWTSDFDFGTHGLITANIDQSSAIAVRCTDGVPYDVGIGAGDGNGASVTKRLMTGAGDATISYALYRDAAYTLNWGKTVGTDTVSGTGNGNTQIITVHGRVPAQTTPKVGIYTDVVAIIVTY